MITQKPRKIEFKQTQPIIGVVGGRHLGPLHPLDSEFLHRFKIEEYVITLGNIGEFVQTHIGHKTNYDAAASEAVRGPTGAGDVFFAAYIANRFLKQMQIRAACRSAARLAARQVGRNYITSGQLDPERSILRTKELFNR